MACFSQLPVGKSSLGIDAVRCSELLGYKVFLDQYVLTAAIPLAIALGEALDTSAGAVMIWSGSYEDSEWCKQEFAKLETLQSLKKGFRERRERRLPLSGGPSEHAPLRKFPGSPSC